MRASNPGNANIQATAAQGTAAAVQQLTATLDKYVNQPNPPEIQQATDRFTDLWEQFTTGLENVQTGRPPGIDFNAVVEGMEEAVTELSKLEAAEVDAAVAVAHTQYADARLEVLLALAVGLVAAVALSLLISASITGRLARVITAMNAMAAGDLSRTTEVAGRDEVGTMASAVNRATSSVRETVAALSRSADLVARSSTQLDSVTAGVGGSAEAVSHRARAADEAAAQVSGNVSTRRMRRCPSWASRRPRSATWSR